MKTIGMKVYSKKGNKWIETYSTNDEHETYYSLARNLTSKYMHKATYIRSMKDVCNYDGTRTITAYYDNGVKAEYTVNE